MSSSPSRTLIPVQMSRSEQPGLRCMGSGASVKSAAKSADVVLWCCGLPHIPQPRAEASPAPCRKKDSMILDTPQHQARRDESSQRGWTTSGGPVLTQSKVEARR